MTVLLAILFIAQAAISSADQPTLTCVVCDKSPLTGKVWVHKSGHVCSDCYGLETRCSLCGLPAKTGFATISDGRIICRLDVVHTILTSLEAKQLFEETRSELKQVLGSAMELKSRQITVTLFDVDYWNTRDGVPVAEALRRTGFSQTRHAGGQCTHNVILLSGQLKTDLMSVCAHEYTHLWINENKAATRVIDTDTLEAICELVAYKLMVQKADVEQQEKIKTNSYTHGQILNLIDTEAQCGFNAILEWVKSGADSKLNSRNLAQFRTDSIVAALRSQAPRTNPAPTTLTLRGLFGTGSRRLALINDRSFAKQEEGKVRVGNQMVSVRCLEILTDSVVLQVNGSRQPITLELDGR